MHSILENDGILSDPYEVLCSIGTLIIEGRTSKIVLDSNHTSEHNEVTNKAVKPYSEGPHCSNHVSRTSKDAHKCGENNVLCIRYKNLRQHLQHLRRMSPSITIEVSLGPDCLCGELRSQSTLVSTQPSKRDTVLEQWRIDMVAHQGQECQNTQMSVLNVYQAVRSLLHFSQLAAWYTSTNGTKPAHVSYRVVVPDDATYIADDKFINHNLPTVNINNTVSIKMSLKTLPRKEAIPTVFCLQHPASSSESSSSGNSRFLESSDRKNYRSLKSSESSLTSSSKADALEDTLPLKFHGVRKKTNDVQERKRKKHITLYAPSTPLVLDGCSSAEILDGIPVNVKEGTNPDFATSKKNPSPQREGETSKVEFKKSKPCTFLAKDLLAIVKHQNDINGIPCNNLEQKLLDALVLDLKGLGDTKRKCDYRTKDMNTIKSSVANVIDQKTIIDILDDRMQISCAISGKHHCKWECDEETDLGNPGGPAEKPKRRRSLSKAVIGEGFDESIKSDGLDFEKIFHGKFKDVECLGESQITEDCESTKPNRPGCSKTIPSDQVVSLNIEKSFVSKVKSLPLTNLPESEREQEVSESGNSSARVRKESLESFKKDCEVVSIAPESSSDSELSDSFLESSNPFLAAILRTTRKSKSHESKRLNGGSRSGSKEGVKSKTGSCANSSSVTDSLETEEITNPFKYFLTRKKISEFEIKGKDTFKKSKLLEKPWHLNEGGLNFKYAKRKSGAVKGPKDLNLGDSPKKSSVFEIDEKKIKHEGIKEADFLDENSAINFSHAKTIPVPSAHDKLRFRRSLDTAAQLVFHRCSGLPLTSSPAPVRRNNNSFSFDSSLNSVSAIKSALFEPANSLSSEDENESEGSLKSPASPGAWPVASKQINYHSLSPLPLLGSFEESVLNGRLEPVSTVQGFTAELGASGSFCPRHLYLPVTVFFYTLGDNDKVSAPYLGHINLGKKGYNVPRSGTIQVTLFNPLRTVVKMFVVVYDLSDMPPNSHTFLRQRTLYVPTGQKEFVETDKDKTPFGQGDYHKYLRYLIHLRFVSGKTGRIYLHTDIRMVIFRKADEDTATALGKQADGETYELRSHTHGPINPKFSPRK